MCICVQLTGRVSLVTEFLLLSLNCHKKLDIKTKSSDTDVSPLSVSTMDTDRGLLLLMSGCCCAAGEDLVLTFSLVSQRPVTLGQGLMCRSTAGDVISTALENKQKEPVNKRLKDEKKSNRAFCSHLFGRIRESIEKVLLNKPSKRKFMKGGLP